MAYSAASMVQVVARAPCLEPYPFFIHTDADRFISDRIRRTGCWEPFESRLLLGLLQPGDQMIDVGANIGWYTLAAAHRVGDGGHVYAFEPDERNHRLLVANINSCHRRCITVERAALGRTGGRASLVHSNENQGDHRVRSFVEDELRGHGAAGSVVVLSLDAYLRESATFDIARLRVLKIDVQGFEYEVLLGARALLSSLPRRAMIFLEFDPALLGESSPGACEGLIDLCSTLDREFYAIARPLWRIYRVGPDELRRCASREPQVGHDLILAHRDSIRDLSAAMPFLPRILSSAALG